MNVKTIALLAVLSLGLLALACTETTVVRSDREGSAGISVSGVGSVLGEPDIAVLTLGVEAEADSVGEARQDAAEAMDAMLAALRDGGVEDDDIQTTRFSVQPQYDFRAGEQELTGFFVQNIVTVNIRNIDDTGDLIDAAADAGGDLARVDNLRFTIDDPTELRDEARRLAVEDAKNKAETLADAAGVDLGEPLSISESGGGGFDSLGGFRLAAVADADFSSTPISVGELEIQINVQIVYALE